ncbi:MAG: peptidoglycan-binding protein [Solirubrobacterales bacterium]|nr:peptidoglycan-binding protein [Solirubrobacterales bacterium]
MGGAETSCEADHRASPRALQRVPAGSVQRKEDESWLGSIFDTISETVGDVLASAGSKVKTALELTEYPSCSDTIGTAPKPDLGTWLDNRGLENLRAGKGLLSKSKVPQGGDRGATKLVKQAVQAWGCETLGLDLLPKSGTTGKFGPETAAAVKQVQLFSGLSIDGVVGAQTLAALDEYVGVAPAGPLTPEVAGGADVQGKSSLDTKTNPVARIFFPTNGKILDDQDMTILRRLADAAEEAEEIEFEVVGYADKREGAAYNIVLSDDRATVVRYHLDDLLDQRKVKAAIAFGGVGEIERPQAGETDLALRPFRRADIHVVRVVHPPEERVCTDILCVPQQTQSPHKQDCSEPTTDWEMRLRNVAAIGPAITWTTMQVDIRTKKRNRNGKRCLRTYLYEAIGRGISAKWLPPVNLGVDSGYEAFSTTVPMRIDQFGGEAQYSGIGAVAGPIGVNAEQLYLYAPQELGGKYVRVSWWGWSTGLGVGISEDFPGELRYYRETREVA